MCTIRKQSSIVKGFIIMLSAWALLSCSPKVKQGFDFRAGELEGVRFERSVSPKATVRIVVICFAFGSVILFYDEK